MKNLIVQLIKFGIVGIIAAVIDFGVLFLLKGIFRADVLIASAIAFSVSVAVNYVLSMLFVFKGKGTSKFKEFILFVILSIGGLLINQLVMWIGTEFTMLHYMIVKIIACIIVPVYNFVTRKIFLEKKSS